LKGLEGQGGVGVPRDCPSKKVVEGGNKRGVPEGMGMGGRAKKKEGRGGWGGTQEGKRKGNAKSINVRRSCEGTRGATFRTEGDQKGKRRKRA